METADLSINSLFYVLLLALPVLIFSYKLKLNINKNLSIAVLRMFIQLTMVGIYLNFIFEINNWFINSVYIVIMVVIASYTISKSGSLNIRIFVFPVFISILLPLILMLTYFNYFIVKLDYLFDAKYLITIGGMLLGNAMNNNIVALKNFFSLISKNEKIYMNTLLLGASREEALIPWFRESIKLAVLPVIASISTIGLVSLPGMMTGQILGGSLPMTAIKYQIAIMMAILTNSFFSVILLLKISPKYAFDKYDMLERKVFKE